MNSSDQALPKDQVLQNVRDILVKNYGLTKDQFILLLYDSKSRLSRILTEAYSSAILQNRHMIIDFDTHSEEAILSQFKIIPPHSVVILVQTVSFRLTKHRLRADLFRAGHLVIEHTRLGYNLEDQIPHYIASLHYNTPYYVHAADTLEQLLSQNHSLRITSPEGNELIVNSAFEKPIKNTGDFHNAEIISAGFPIGEIFTEAKELEKMNGTLLVFGFPGKDHLVHFTDQFTVTIENGCLISHTGPAQFEEIVRMIRDEEVTHTVQVREIGFGLNPSLGFDHRLNEPTAFERFAGMHFSLGLKHAMYAKKLGRKVFQKYHIDLFCLVKDVFIGETQVIKEGKYVV
ncbi:hypothetical protein HY495_00385 [Candidatus Woesearchaeota archaeon]|nr:hypothetical protein [Candidatus Woesearchaeota archaeon]